MNGKDNNRLEYAAELRKRAEEITRKQALALPKSISPNTQKIIQELHVHQIELEMQNEELLRTQVKLDVERERYFDFYNLAPVGYLTISGQRLILEANLTVATLLGRNRVELDKQPITQFIFKEDQEIYYLHRKQLFDNREPQSFELRMVKKDNTIFWTLLTISSAQDTSGIPECRVVLSDITDCKRAEDALADIASQWQNTFDAVNDGVCLLDRDQHIIRCNKVMSDLFSKNSSDMIGKICCEVIHGTKQPIPECPIMKMIKTLQRESIELKIADRWFEVTGDPFFDADKKLAGIVHIIRDITKRKQSEEKITMLAQAVENTAECIGITDKDYNFVFVNSAFLPIYGYTKDELIGRPVAIIHSENNATEVSNNLFSTLAKNQTWKGEVLNKRKDGSDFPVLLTLSPLLNEKGELVGSVGIAKDITELKQAEDEIKLKKEELQKVNAEKDKFFSIIAHDLRSPFQGFLGLTQEMAEELPRLAKDEMQKIAVGMRDSATNLFRLIESLLQWASVQQGLIPFKPEVVQLLPVVNESIAMALKPARDKGIEITYDIPADIKVLADSNMLQSVIRNLVSNAIKFTAKNGKISLSSKVTDNNTVEISIKDSGIGMNGEMVDNLFRVDVRTNRKGTEGELSTGLGLLLCKEFIEKNGGKIRVESEEGKGSVFYFTIPFNSEHGSKSIAEIAPAIEEKKLFKDMKILIVEDDKQSEILIKIVGRSLAREILIARTGVEALEICRKTPDIDLILMDIAMPEMDGDEATRQIRKFNKDVIIIAQTAYAFAGEREKSIAAGCNDYIAKPYNKTTLTALLKKYF